MHRDITEKDRSHEIGTRVHNRHKGRWEVVLSDEDRLVIIAMRRSLLDSVTVTQRMAGRLYGVAQSTVQSRESGKVNPPASYIEFLVSGGDNKATFVEPPKIKMSRRRRAIAWIKSLRPSRR